MEFHKHKIAVFREHRAILIALCFWVFFVFIGHLWVKEVL